MKRFIVKKAACLGIIALMGYFVFSCIEDDSDGYTSENENTKINDWISENMSLYYLWNDQIPQRTNKNLPPADYFESLLSPEDRFSWIEENFIELMESLAGVSKEAGYEFNLLLLEENSDKVIGYISYIKPNSPASRTRLKRGDFFLTINETPITTSNYISLINSTYSPHKLGIAVDFPNNMQTENISLQVEKYEENPIFLDTIYQINNRKIAYLVYNFFAADNGDNSIRYEKELNDIFADFKGVNDLILDLRYNSGGLHSTAVALASMISNRTSRDIFSITSYNSLIDNELRNYYGSDYNKSYFVDYLERRNDKNEIVEKLPINKAGVDKLYVITSQNTASASEVLINALKPFMDIKLIGDTTVGKNVGSITIYEDDPVKQETNQWGMQPIFCKIANSQGFSDYDQGFIPDIASYEFDSRALILPLGDTDEILLQKALYLATGGQFKSSSGGVPRFQALASSTDRKPARKNMYIYPPVRLTK
jgi:C-terminal processing protease CtpA/Prc